MKIRSYLKSYISIDKVLQINIYNRYGALLFSRGLSEANESELGWDGTYENQLLNSGVFIYEISVQLVNGDTFYQTGSIALIR